MHRTVFAPAKINLRLEVLGRRTDGYHDLAMIMQKVSLGDRLRISLSGRSGVRVVCPGLDLPEGMENIAARAANRLLERLKKPVGIDIVIDKQIPAAAGLGGGSSDAAAVLLALNDLLGLHLDRPILMREGAALGADVPFFLYDGSAWATGIGDILEPFPLPPAWYVLVNPGLPVSTAWAYGKLGLTTSGAAAKMPGFPRTTRDLTDLLRNDLERVTVARYPLLAEIKKRLLAAGAVGALMSGSGPTIFGLFNREETAIQAALRIAGEEPGWRIFNVRPL